MPVPQARGQAWPLIAARIEKPLQRRYPRKTGALQLNRDTRGLRHTPAHLLKCTAVLLQMVHRALGLARVRTGKYSVPSAEAMCTRASYSMPSGQTHPNIQFTQIFTTLFMNLTRYCLSVRPNHSGFTAWLCRQGQRYPGAVWTRELRLEPVATVSSGHRP